MNSAPLRGIAAFGAFAAFGPACDSGSFARPTFDSAARAGAADSDGAAANGGFPLDASIDAPPQPINLLCPDAMGPTFPSILTQMLATGSCGVNQSYDCHSTTGASAMGNRSGLDFSLDAAAVYAELLGDGGGYPSTNVQGDAGGPVPRVLPGDAGASMLYIKLAMPTPSDPRYGQAMPPRYAVCASALDAVRAWIDDGAAAN